MTQLMRLDGSWNSDDQLTNTLKILAERKYRGSVMFLGLTVINVWREEAEFKCSFTDIALEGISSWVKCTSAAGISIGGSKALRISSRSCSHP